MSTSACWELTCDGLVSCPGGVIESKVSDVRSILGHGVLNSITLLACFVAFKALITYFNFHFDPPIFTSWMMSSMRFGSEANSLDHLVTHINFDREINLFIKFTELISSQLFCHKNSFTRWLFIDQYLDWVSMWDSRLHVVIGEHHIEFYYKKIRQCFIDSSR